MAGFRSIFSPGDAKDITYRNLYNMNTPEARTAKEFVERLWAEYHSYADRNCLTHIRNDFHARFWEMYLTCALLQHSLQQGYSVSCPKSQQGGPDILVEHDGFRIWIEAVTPTDGDQTKVNSVNKPDLRQGYTVPDEKITLRYILAIDDKYKQYLSYRKKGIISENDAYIVAVNSCRLFIKLANPRIPRILKAVFPIGQLESSFDSGEIRYQFRQTIHKSGEEIPTGLFLNKQYCVISAILHSYADAGMGDHQLGIDFFVVHNPMASPPVPHGLIAANRECSPTPGDDKYIELSIPTTPDSNTAVRTLSDLLDEISNSRRYRGPRRS